LELITETHYLLIIYSTYHIVWCHQFRRFSLFFVVCECDVVIIPSGAMLQLASDAEDCNLPKLFIKQP